MNGCNLCQPVIIQPIDMQHMQDFQELPEVQEPSGGVQRLSGGDVAAGISRLGGAVGDEEAADSTSRLLASYFLRASVTYH